MLSLYLFHLGVVCAGGSAISLLAKAESIRGAGRIFSGISTMFLAAAFFLLSGTEGGIGTAYLPFSIVLGFTGLVTVGSGIRKYGRRNSSD